MAAATETEKVESLEPVDRFLYLWGRRVRRLGGNCCRRSLA